MSEEVWKDIAGYEGFYKVSNMGRVKRVRTNFKYEARPHNTFYERILRPIADKDGYLRVDLSANGTAKHKQIHRLVAIAFIPNPNNFPMINHKDENKRNNRADNLEWCDSAYNNNYGTKKEKCRGSLHPRSKLTEDDVSFIRKNYQPRSKQFGIRALAQKFSVAEQTVYHVIHFETWTHI